MKFFILYLTCTLVVGLTQLQTSSVATEHQEKSNSESVGEKTSIQTEFPAIEELKESLEKQKKEYEERAKWDGKTETWEREYSVNNSRVRTEVIDLESAPTVTIGLGMILLSLFLILILAVYFYFARIRGSKKSGD